MGQGSGSGRSQLIAQNARLRCAARPTGQGQAGQHLHGSRAHHVSHDASAGPDSQPARAASTSAHPHPCSTSHPPATMEAKLSSMRIMSAASLLTSLPEMPMASPVLAFFRAGASFTPSPVTATFSPAGWGGCRIGQGNGQQGGSAWGGEESSSSCICTKAPWQEQSKAALPLRPQALPPTCPLPSATRTAALAVLHDEQLVGWGDAGKHNLLVVQRPVPLGLHQEK